MIILDLSQILYANIAVQANKSKDLLTEDFIRHLALTSIRKHKMAFSKEYGKLVIACDGRNSWRKAVFPFYKANRKKSREETGLDWKMIFAATDKIITELQETFPYTVIRIDTAEADDVIAVLCGYVPEPILIVSEDKDFIQLHRDFYPQVRQYNPVKSSFLNHPDPKSYLYEHIVRGDTGDGIPNIKSGDNWLVIGQRQGRITSKQLEKWRNGDIMSSMEERNYKRNEQLIDLKHVPLDIKEKILEDFESQKDKKAKGLFQYFTKHRLKMLMENINDFN